MQIGCPPTEVERGEVAVKQAKNTDVRGQGSKRQFILIKVRFFDTCRLSYFASFLLLRPSKSPSLPTFFLFCLPSIFLSFILFLPAFFHPSTRPSHPPSRLSFFPIHLSSHLHQPAFIPFVVSSSPFFLIHAIPPPTLPSFLLSGHPLISRLSFCVCPSFIHSSPPPSYSFLTTSPLSFYANLHPSKLPSFYTLWPLSTINQTSFLHLSFHLSVSSHPCTHSFLPSFLSHHSLTSCPSFLPSSISPFLSSACPFIPFFHPLRKWSLASCGC